MLTVGSLFSGIGGFDLGFERAGMTVRWQSEIDPQASRVLAHHFPGVPNHGDITAIDGAELEPVDVITGGFPCQDLSVAGKRAGLNGARSGLFFEFMRVVREMRDATAGLSPSLVVIENVPGLLNSHGGADFGVLLDTLADLGALDIGWRVLDAQWFGVAQRRRRVFVVVDFGGRRAGEILALAEGLRGDTPPRRTTGQGVAGTLGGGAGERGWAPDTDRMTFVPYDPAQTVSSKWSKGTGGPAGDEVYNLVAQAVPFRKSRRAQSVDDHETWVEDDVANTLNTFDNGDVRTTEAIAFAMRGRAEGSVPEPSGDVSPAIRGASGGSTHTHVATAFNWQNAGNAGYAMTEDGTGPLDTSQTKAVFGQQMAVRRLTPRECERLQGFPDDWTLVDSMADGPRYRMLGNAVAVPVAEWLGKQIARTM